MMPFGGAKASSAALSSLPSVFIVASAQQTVMERDRRVITGQRFHPVSVICPHGAHPRGLTRGDGSSSFALCCQKREA